MQPLVRLADLVEGRGVELDALAELEQAGLAERAGVEPAPLLDRPQRQLQVVDLAVAAPVDARPAA
jgi:hypothetical protein